MAEGFLGTGFNLKGMFTFSMDGMLIVVLALFGAVLIYLMYLYFSYNKRIIIRKVTNGRKVFLYDKAKLFKGKDGTLSYKFQKLKIKAQVPPPEAIEITSKGKEVLECYLSETGEVTWIIDKNDKIGILQPFTTNQRQMLQHQFYKAHLEKGQSWTEKLGMIVYVGALVVIIIAMMVFYGDMGKPLLQMGEQLADFQNTQNEMMIKQNEMMDKLMEMQDRLMIQNNQNTGGSPAIPNRQIPN